MTKSVEKKVVTETTDEKGNKKVVVKEYSPKEIAKKKSDEKKLTARERDELLIENFVGLQHAMTNMSIKFGALSDNISKLLQIFEESAKNFVSGGKPDDEDMLKKIDSLLDQNKTIAKGLVLMEGKLRGRTEMPQSTMPQPTMQPGPQQGSLIKPRPLPSI